MKAVLSTVLGLVAMGALVVAVHGEAKKAEKGKEVTLKGTITCAKCGLHETDSCQTAIQVKDDNGKTETYYFAKGGENPHSKICKEAKEGEVTGVVSEKNGQKWIKVSKVTFSG
ncbi:MAG: hypothetical protein JO112_01020 [Planctomycetes bacterium]|nr:hypothetical protein [Planctomycetota bacterium]